MIGMGRIIWILFLALAAPAFFVSLRWLNLLIAPKKIAARLHWSVLTAFWMNVFFTVILLAIYATVNAVALRFGIWG